MRVSLRCLINDHLRRIWEKEGGKGIFWLPLAEYLLPGVLFLLHFRVAQRGLCSGSQVSTHRTARAGRDRAPCGERARGQDTDRDSGCLEVPAHRERGPRFLSTSSCRPLGESSWEVSVSSPAPAACFSTQRKRSGDGPRSLTAWWP